MAAFPKVGWIVIGLGVVIGAVFGFTKKANAASPEPAKPNPKSPTVEKPPVVVTPTELSDAKSAKYYEDENGVRWEFYGWDDGTWEATIIDPSVAAAYVRNFHELDPADVIFMIKSHAETYDADGVLKPGLIPDGPVELQNYSPTAMCGGERCWSLADPTSALSIPSIALTGPLKPGDMVTYYLAEKDDVKVSAYVCLVTAIVVSEMIPVPPNDYNAGNPLGSYSVKISSATMMHGTAPTKLPPVGYTVIGQWRQYMIDGNPFA